MSTVRDVVKSFDSSQELGQAEKEAVQALAALGEAKAELFKMEIEKLLLTAGTAGRSNLTVPVTSIIAQTSQVRAFSSTEIANIKGVIDKAMGSFLKGSAEGIVQGISGLMQESLEIFWGGHWCYE